MKRILLKTLSAMYLSALSVVSYAQDNKKPFDGIYVGAEAGILNSFAKINSTSSLSGAVSSSFPPDFPIGLAFSTNATLDKNFGVGAFSIGFGKLIQGIFYLGGELGVNVANRDNNLSGATDRLNLNTLSTNTQTKLNFAEFDIDFKGGTILNQNLLTYARIGAAFNQLKINSNTTALLFNNPDFFETNNYTTSKKIIGFRVGAGAEYYVTEKLVAKLDYIFTWYGTKNMTGTNSTVNSRTALFFTTSYNHLTNTTSAKISTQAVMAGLSYYFNT